MRYIILILFIPSTATAEWEWKLGAILFAAPNHLILHEGSHAVAGLSLGYDVMAFKPFPHNYEGKFYFGRVEINSYSPNDNEKLVFYSAPYIMDIGIFAMSDILMSRSKGVSSFVIYTLGMVAPFIDFTKSYIHSLDWDRMRGTRYGMVVNLVGAVTIGIGVWRIVKGFNHIWR